MRKHMRTRPVGLAAVVGAVALVTVLLGSPGTTAAPAPSAAAQQAAAVASPGPPAA